MRKFLIAVLGGGALLNVQSAFAKPNCDSKWAKCQDNADYVAGISKRLGDKARSRCESNVLICRVSGYWPPTGERMPPGPPIKDAEPGSPPKDKGKGRTFTGDESGWNGKYTSIVIRDGRGTRTITVKQGVPIENGLMVLGPDGVRYHIWDPKLGKQLEALGLKYAYANDNTAREVFAKAKAEAAAAAGGGKKATTHGDGSKVDQATLNGTGSSTKGLGASGTTPTGAHGNGGTTLGATTIRGTGAATTPKTTSPPAAINVGIAKPVAIPGPVSNSNRRQLQ